MDCFDAAICGQCSNVLVRGVDRFGAFNLRDGYDLSVDFDFLPVSFEPKFLSKTACDRLPQRDGRFDGRALIERGDREVLARVDLS